MPDYFRGPYEKNPRAIALQPKINLIKQFGSFGLFFFVLIFNTLIDLSDIKRLLSDNWIYFFQICSIINQLKQKLMSKIIEYAKNRFVHASKILDCSVYSKQSKDADNTGNYPVVHRVAISLDATDVQKSTVYSDAYATEEEARKVAIQLLTQLD